MRKILLAVYLFLTASIGAEAKNFTVVIDPGHGGGDPGVVRAGYYESHIVLNIALYLGELLEKNHSDIDVVYTRKTDIRLTEDERIKRINDGKGDVLVSIHVNAAYNDKTKKDITTVHGVEVYIQTIENSDRKTRTLQRNGTIISIGKNNEEIEGKYDASSAQYDAIYQMKQAQVLNLSNYLATYIRNAMDSESRNIRGVKQKSLYLTWRSTMPNVLVEVGYITNSEERAFMTSNTGQKMLAQGIYNGIIAYKNDFDMSKTSEAAVNPPKQDKQQNNVQSKGADVKKDLPQNNGIVFKWQVLTSTVLLKDDDSRLKKLKCSYYKQGKLYKYTYGESTDYQEIDNMKNEIRQLFHDAFIIAMKNGERIDVEEARRQTNQ
jgi:N-acetylmuramoyl-L-alanine amidase